MKAFMAPLQGLAEFEQIKEKSKTKTAFCKEERTVRGHGMV